MKTSETPSAEPTCCVYNMADARGLLDASSTGHDLSTSCSAHGKQAHARLCTLVDGAFLAGERPEAESESPSELRAPLEGRLAV